MIGRTLGSYRIVQQLGRGGAGIVYRAEDPRLGRDVAIKVLHEQALRDERALARFRQEARSLSRLLHPNIATLFDFDSHEGCDFIVLEYVPGETLAEMLAHGPLPEARGRAITLEIADALQFAHDEGIVHRDLKPGNIILTPRGRAKVLDFGLARLLQDEKSDASAETISRISRTSSGDSGALIGTLPYMAPEQVTGGAIDARTDIYALGAVLYEMVAGDRPYSAEDIAGLVYQIAHVQPSPLRAVAPAVSAQLESIVMTCLEKDPTRRFPTAAQVSAAVRAVASPASDARQSVDPAPYGQRPAFATEASAPRQSALTDAGSDSSRAPGRIRSIAVLPLENRSGDAEQEFFADGMTDALIADLAQVGALRVISRTSSMRFKAVRRSLPEIARDLRVDGIVEGSVLRSGDRVRITAQLVDAATDTTIWAK